MIIGGEVDAGRYSALKDEPSYIFADSWPVWDAKPENKDEPVNWVELKTSEEIRQDRDDLKFERKLLKIWAQSFLLGVPKVIVGFRSKDGILKRIEELETKTIPGNVKKKGRGSWDGNLCINFAASFLQCKCHHLSRFNGTGLKSTGLQGTVSDSGVWRIRKREQSPGIEVFKVEESGYGDILTPDFIRWRQTLPSNNGTEPVA